MDPRPSTVTTDTAAPPLPALRGLTWAHPRGYGPVEALAATAPARYRPLMWDRHSLAGFESTPIADLVRSYDLLVIDHPGIGAAVAANALTAYDDLTDQPELTRWRDDMIEGSYDSYHYLDRQWAIPIDAATQVCAYRHDLLPDPPTTWDETIRTAERHTVCIPTATPHTLLTFLGIAAAIDPGFVPTVDHLVPRSTALAAHRVLATLFHLTPSKLRGLDPIGVLDAMATTVNIACSPLIFGYVTYTRPQPSRQVITFTNAPADQRGGTPGSVLGGAGLAISGHCRDHAAALAHVRRMTDTRSQQLETPAAGGQPAAAAAWRNPLINNAYRSFYRNTRHSHGTAWRRPRYPGWIRTQTNAGELLNTALDTNANPNAALDQLDALFRNQHPEGWPN